MERRGTPSASDLREYLRVLRRRKWAILLITGISVASAMAFSIRETPIYASTAKILVKPPTANQYLQNVPAASLVSMDTERQLVQSEAVAAIATQEMGATSGGSDLPAHVSVSVPVNTQILEITFSDPDPAVAQKGARSFADAYLEFKTTQALQAFTSVRTGIQKQIDALQGKLNDARIRLAAAAPGSTDAQQAQSDIDTITSQIVIYRNQMGTLSVLDVDPGDVIQPADLPTSPVSPNFFRNGALALVAGLVLGVGLAFLRERLDDRLGGRDDFGEAIGAPVLALIPKVAGWSKRDQPELATLKTPKGAPAEAYRTIRTNLQFIARNPDFKVIAVTSPALGEGKTTTCANLAVSLAQTGKRVIAVSCDLRKPRLHRFFNASNEFGLTSILIRQTSAMEAVQRVGVDGLRLIASGPVPPNPAELLESAEMDALLDQLRRAADFLILDTAPVLAVSDTLILAPKSDGVVIVADSSTTTRGAVLHTREQLEQVGGHIIGGVFNNFDPSRAKYYPSYYHYDYSYRHRPEGKETILTGNADGADAGSPEDMWGAGNLWR